MDYFKILPEEITLEVLSRLPTESVLESKLVCRNWRNLVSQNPLFSKMHFNHHLNHPADSGFIAWTNEDGRNQKFQYFEYNENHESVERITRLNFNFPFGEHTVFVDSCNGLICLTGFPSQPVCIWNPVTRECIMLPEINRIGMDTVARSGFGYVPSTDEYKVVRMMSEKDTEYIQVYVYTLGSGLGWRNIGKFNFGNIKYWGNGIFVNANGDLYWLNHLLAMIFPFDLAEEEFGDQLVFPLSPGGEFDGPLLHVLDGCLAFAITGARFWIIWLLKKKNGNNDMKEQREQHHSMGWSEEFSVSYSEPFAVTKSYNFLTFHRSRRHINIHDPEASTSKRIVEFKESLVLVFPHKNTLVSLKEIGGEDTKIMESVEIGETESHDSPLNKL